MNPFERILIIEQDDVLTFAESEEKLASLKRKASDVFNTVGPASPRYLDLLREISLLYLEEKDYSRALSLAGRIEHLLSSTMTERRLANFLVIARCLIEKGNTYDASNLVKNLLTQTENHVIGRWSVYLRSRLLSLFADLAFLAREGQRELSLRREALDELVHVYGDDVTITHDMRVPLALCLEKNGREDMAYVSYSRVLLHYSGHQLFSSPTEAVSLLAHMSLCLRRLGEKEREEQTLGIISSLIRETKMGSARQEKLLAYIREM